MPDITMCPGDGCPLRKVCYRYIADPSELYQSYFTEVHYDPEFDRCTYFWDIGKGDPPEE